MVEFLPLNEFDSKQNGGNHWGYMPLGYFSLARKYAFDKTQGTLLDEFRSMINEFHKNDIKVLYIDEEENLDYFKEFIKVSDTLL